MRAPIRRVRQFAFLFVFGVLLAAQAADDAAAVGVVDKVENGAKVLAGDTVTVAIIGMPVHLRDELRTAPDGRLRVTFSRRHRADTWGKGERRHRSLRLRP